MQTPEIAALDLSDELAERARAGDRAAFARLYDRTWAPICRHTMRMLGRDPERAREIAQEAFTRAWAAIGQTAPGLRFRPWIYRIATNLCLHELEKRRPTTEVDEMPDLDREGPDARGLRADERRRVWRTLASLPPRARQVLVLREIDELGFDELALVLGTTVGNVQVMLHRARRRFAQVLSSTIPGDDEPPSLACAEFDELLGRYVDGDVDATARARLAQHLEVCSGCDAERKNQRAAAAMLAALPLTTIPGAPGWFGGAGAAGVSGGGGAASSVFVASGAAAGASAGAGLSSFVAAKATLLHVAALLGVAALATAGVVHVVRGGFGAAPTPRQDDARQHASVPRAPARSAAAAMPVAPAATVEARPAAGAVAAVAPRAPQRPRAPAAARTVRSRAAPVGEPAETPPSPTVAPEPRVPFGRVLFGAAGGGRGGPLAAGARLRPGGALRAPGFVAFVLGTANVLRTEPGTRLRMTREHERPTILLEDGEIWARRSSQDLQIRAGDVQIDPQGGAVRVRTSLGHTVVEALADGVAAQVRGQRIVLARNQSVASDAPRPVTLPSAPTGLSPTSWNGTGAPELAWEEVPGARHYRLELARSADFLEVESALTTDGTSARPVTTIGRHFFRVLTEDAAGRRSPSSKIHSFFVEPVGP
jgi:RNA polymerase sigma-70 factor (ECF subfamily)